MGGGRLFEAGRLLTFPAYKMDAYSRWALIRGWVLNRINTVNSFNIQTSCAVRYSAISLAAKNALMAYNARFS